MAKNNRNKGITLRRGAIKKGGIDARQKIIQKKRKTVVDARDIISRVSKTQQVDARDKLTQLRHKNRASTTSNIRAIGNNILRKTDRNGKISLVTNKHKRTSNLNLKIQQQLGLVSPQRMKINKKIVPKKPVRLEYETPIIKKTIRNEYSPPMMRPYGYDHPDLYRWYPGISPIFTPIELRRPVIDLTASRASISDSSSGRWKSFSPNMRSINGYVDLDAVDDEEMPMISAPRPGMSRMSSNVHSRLDTKPQSNSTHGILSQTKTKVVVPMGHRIVVSNLQSSVTQDDIRELFEDIGQLLVAKLVRPGTAEVIYKNLKDAQKAVDTYHNRQLDGQPMKCLLVNKRPLNHPTAPAIKTSSMSLLSGRIAPKVTSTNKLVVPDISTIHKVLFQRN